MANMVAVSCDRGRGYVYGSFLGTETPAVSVAAELGHF